MSLIKKSFQLATASGLSAVFIYFYRIAGARSLGADNYGLLALLLAVLNIITLVFASSVPPAIAKFVAEKYRREDIYRTAKTRFPLVGICISILLVIASHFYGYFHCFLILALTVPVIMFLAVGRGWLQGIGDIKTFGCSQIVHEGSKFFLLLFFLYFGFEVLGAVLAIFFGTILAVLYVGRHVTVYDGRDTDFIWKKLMGYFVPISFTRIIDGFIMNLDTIFLKIWFSFEVVGVYNAAGPIARIPLLAFIALSTVLLPEVSNKKEKTREFLRSSMRFCFLILLPGVLLIALFPGFFINLFFGAEYLEAVPALRILIFSSFFIGLYKVFASVLQGLGRPYDAAWIFLVVLMCNVLLNCLLIPAYGMMGASLANLMSGILAAVLALLTIKRYLKLKDKVSLWKRYSSRRTST